MDILLIIFLLVALAIGILAAESDNFVFTTAVIISTFAGLDLFFGWPIWASILANPFTILLFAFGYLIVGSAYTAIWRWPEFLRDNKDKIRNDFAKYIKEHVGATEEQYMNSANYTYNYSASSNKTSLANWVLAWPLSLTWELARKPAIWLWDNVYELLGTTFDRIGKSVSRKILRSK